MSRHKHSGVGWALPVTASPGAFTPIKVSSEVRAQPDGSGSEAEQPSAYTEGGQPSPSPQSQFCISRAGRRPHFSHEVPDPPCPADCAQGKRRRPRRLALALSVAIAAVLASLVLAPAAGAAYNPIASGTTRLTLAKPFLALLKQNGVKLSGTAGATLKGGVVTFPVSGGKFDPTTSKGFVEHAGALLFRTGSRKVPLTSLQLKTTQKHAPFSAKFGGGQLKVASAEKLTVTREGFGDKVAVSSLKLSAKVATRLDKKLHLKGVFVAGQPIGTAVTAANPQTVAVAQSGAASFVFDPAIAAKLQSLFVAINPIFPAEHPGPFTLPIFTGTISPSGTEGTIQTLGAIELVQIGGGQVFLREGWIELGAAAFAPELELDPSPPFPGRQGRLSVGVLGLTGAAISSDPAARTIAVAGATVTMGANLAAAFDEAFAKPQNKADVFQAGEQLGTISFTAQAE
jgi:hypothetical protein